MSSGVFRRARSAALHPEPILPDAAAIRQLGIVGVPTNLLLVCAWAAVGIVVSTALTALSPPAEPLVALLAFG